MNKSILMLVFLWVTSAIAFCQSVPPGTSEAVVNRLSKRVPVRAVHFQMYSQLAGRYTNESEEMLKRVGGFLTGDDLYLFSDGTYIFSEWGDAEPITIRDKGRWAIEFGLLKLRSDPDVTWQSKGIERMFATLRRTSRPHEVMLVGTVDQLQYFEKEAKDDPEFMLLICSRLRTGKFNKKAEEQLKSELMRTAWRPEFFAEIGVGGK